MRFFPGIMHGSNIQKHVMLRGIKNNIQPFVYLLCVYSVVEEIKFLYTRIIINYEVILTEKLSDKVLFYKIF